MRDTGTVFLLIVGRFAGTCILHGLGRRLGDALDQLPVDLCAGMER